MVQYNSHKKNNKITKENRLFVSDSFRYFYRQGCQKVLPHIYFHTAAWQGGAETLYILLMVVLCGSHTAQSVSAVHVHTGLSTKNEKKKRNKTINLH